MKKEIEKLLLFGRSVLSFVIGALVGLIIYIVSVQDSYGAVEPIKRVQKIHIPTVEETEIQWHIHSGYEFRITPEISTPEDIEEEIWYDSLEYLAMCVEAEAGNQSELGKRLVCDVILNRYYSGSYNNFYEVINEKGQFAVVSNGSIEVTIPTEDTYRIVQEELECRTNTEVMFFRAGQFHSFGTPLFKEGAHYFSM